MKPIILVGYMTSGKSNIGLRLSKALNLSFLDVDVFIENRFRKRIVDLFALWGEDTFRKRESTITHEIVGFQDTVIATGGGLPCFYDNMDILLSNGIVVYLDVSEETLSERLSLCKQTRPTVKNKTDEEISVFVKDSMLHRRPIYEKAHITVEASGNNNEDNEIRITQNIIDKLNKYGITLNIK